MAQCHTLRPVIFSSGIFLYYFLPLFLLSYYVSPKGLRSLVIALWSYLFYGWWRPDFVLLMLISTVVDFSCGRGIVGAQARGKQGKPYLWTSLLVNLGLLGYFKYANFGIDSLNLLLAQWGQPPLEWAHVVLPVGISFYTFQTLSYTIDIYRGRIEACDRLLDYLAFVSFFPQLVAGPIERAASLLPQFLEPLHRELEVLEGRSDVKFAMHQQNRCRDLVHARQRLGLQIDLGPFGGSPTVPGDGENPTETVRVF